MWPLQITPANQPCPCPVQSMCKNCAIAHLNLKFAHQGEKIHTPVSWWPLAPLLLLNHCLQYQSFSDKCWNHIQDKKLSIIIILTTIKWLHLKWPHLFDTFQVGRKKAELDRLVQRSLRRCHVFFFLHFSYLFVSYTLSLGTLDDISLVEEIQDAFNCSSPFSLPKFSTRSVNRRFLKNIARIANAVPVNLYSKVTK